MLSLAACKAPVGTTSSIEVPRDSRATCSNHCVSIGLELSSVVVMANNVGCVCAVPATPSTPAPAPAAPQASAAAGGMAAILMQQRAAQQSMAATPPPGRR